MNVKLRALILGLIIAGGLAIGAWVLWSREPEHEGKTLSFWLARLGENETEKQVQAAEAICHIGSNAVPAVIRLLNYKEGPLRRRMREIAAKQSYVKLQFENPGRRRQRGMVACDALGPMAAPVIPTLLNLLTNERPPQPDFPYLLARIGSPAVPSLNIALTNDAKVIRWGAKYCLELLRTNAALLHLNDRSVEERDYYLRISQYHLMLLGAAQSDYDARHRRSLADTSPDSQTDNINLDALEQPQRTNAPSPFE